MLLDFPDVQAVTAIKTAGIEDIMNLIEKFVEDGEYNPPEPFQNLQLGIEMCQNSYLKYKNAGLEDDKLELFRRWIDEAVVMLQPPQPNPEEIAAMQGAQLQATPGQVVDEGIADVEPTPEELAALGLQ